MFVAGTSDTKLGLLQGHRVSKPHAAASCGASPKHALAPLLSRLEGGCGLADTAPGHASQGGCLCTPGRLALAREGHAQRLFQNLLELRVAGFHIGHDAIQKLVCMLRHLLPQFPIHLSQQCLSASTTAAIASNWHDKDGTSPVGEEFLWKVLGLQRALYGLICEKFAFSQDGRAHQAVHQLLHPRRKLLAALLHVPPQDAHLQHAARLMARRRVHCQLSL